MEILWKVGSSKKLKVWTFEAEKRRLPKKRKLSSESKMLKEFTINLNNSDLDPLEHPGCRGTLFARLIDFATLGNGSITVVDLPG